jgi:hypothetical protein
VIRRHRIARNIAVVAGIFLCIIGVLHDAMNLPALTRSIARGAIPARMGAQLQVNVAFAGVAFSLLGVFLLLIARDLGKGKRAAWRIGVVVGVFFFLVGVAAYLWIPKAVVLIFSVLGATVFGPLLLWSKDFSTE